MASKRTGIATYLAAFAPIAAGLVASTILFVDYTRPAPVFCDGGGGCDAVRRTVFAHVLGVPTPTFGVLGFVALFSLSSLRGPRIRLAQLLFAAVAALFAAIFLGVQQSIGAFCKYCVVADLSLLVILLVSILRFRLGEDPPAAPRLRGLLLAMLLLSVVGVSGWGIAHPVAVAPRPAFGEDGGPPPAIVLDEIAKTPADKVLVIDFVDFECPFCRETHGELSPLLERHKDRIRFVRKHVPLRMHPHAKDAAKAAICCGEQGKEDAMSEALVKAPVDSLTPEGCRSLARGLGVDLDRYDGCLRAAGTDERLNADLAYFRAQGPGGLPTIWIGKEKIVGATERAEFQQAFSRAGIN